MLCLNMRLLPYFRNDFIYLWYYCAPCFHFTIHNKAQAGEGIKCSWEVETSHFKPSSAHLEERMTFSFQPTCLHHLFVYSHLHSSWLVWSVAERKSLQEIAGVWKVARVCGWLAGRAADRRVYLLESKGNGSHVL